MSKVDQHDSMVRFPLGAVELLESPFAATQDMVRRYVVDFPEDRLVHTFRLNAGLPSAAKPLGGWERPDCKVRGQILGHFLMACARFYAGGKAPELREKSQRIVDELSLCQDALGGGYLSAFPESEFDTLEERRDDGVWAPYYVIHKIMQGLLDCHLYCGNNKALNMTVEMAAYFRRRMSCLSAWQIDGMLRCTKINPKNEFGGMSEVLHRLYTITKDNEHLRLAHLFDRPYFIDPLIDGRDVLSDLHANTHIPMISGAARHYEITGDRDYRYAVENFWNILTDGYTYANGNSSGPAAVYQGGTSDKSEHWGAPGVLSETLRGGECECCCGHNTRKVVGDLLRWSGESRYGDHIERLMYNTVLNSASRRTGMSQYHQPLGTGATKLFGTEFDTFWCCTGSGIEAFSEIQNDVFFCTGYAAGFVSEPVVAVNLYIPSKLDWDEAGIRLEMTGNFPVEETMNVAVRVIDSRRFTVKFRVAYWVDGEPEVCVNDEAIGEPVIENGYVCLERLWKDGDEVRIRFPMKLHTAPMPDDPSIVACMFGPVMLAALGSHEIVFDSAMPSLRRVAGRELRFEAETRDGRGSAIFGVCPYR